MKRILELGSGKGNRLRHLKSMGQITAVDIEYYEELDELCKEIGAEYAIMNAQRLSFGDCIFDVVCAYDLLEHVERTEDALREMVRVVKKGGTIIIEVPHQISERLLLKINPQYWDMIEHKHFFDEEKIRRMLADNGLDVIKTKRTNGIVALQLSLLMFLGGKIESQCGIMSNTNMFFNFICGFFREDLFKGRYHKYFFPIWLFTLPIGYLLSHILPKSIHVKAVKI